MRAGALGTAGCALLITTAGILPAGCAYHRLVVPEPIPGSAVYYTRNSSAFFWGAVERREVASECQSNALSEVRVVTSVPQALATVLTLGIWMPSTVQYKCGKRPLMEGDMSAGSMSDSAEDDKAADGGPMPFTPPSSPQPTPGGAEPGTGGIATPPQGR